MLMIFGYILLSMVAIVFFPQLDKMISPSNVPANLNPCCYHSIPGPITFIGTGLALSLFTACLLYFGLASKMQAYKKFFLYAILYNVLIIIIKFTLAPFNLYSYNQQTPFLIGVDPLANLKGQPLLTLIFVSLFALALYLLIFYIINKVSRNELNQSLTKGTALKTGFPFFATILTFLILIITSILPFAMFIIPGLGGAFGNYLMDILWTGPVFGIIIALLLLAAVVLCGKASQSAASAALAVKDVAILNSFIIVGFGLLIFFHFLWVVYMFTLATLWPFNVAYPGGGK